MNNDNNEWMNETTENEQQQQEWVEQEGREQGTKNERKHY